MLALKSVINEDTKFYFAEVQSQIETENGMSAIIIDSPSFQHTMYCEVEEAEDFVKQLQKHIAMHKMRVNSPPSKKKK